MATTHVDMNDIDFGESFFTILTVVNRAFPDPEPAPEDQELTPKDLAAMDWEFIAEMEPRIDDFYDMCETVGEMLTSKTQAMVLWDTVLDRKLRMLVGPEAVDPHEWIGRLPDIYELVAEHSRNVLMQHVVD